MSYINFLMNGIDDKQEIWQRGKYPEDSIEPIGTSHSYLGQVTKVDQDDKSKTVVIDNAIKITTISDQIRNEHISKWENLKKFADITFVATLIGGIIGIVATVAMSIALTTMLSVALAIGILTLGILWVAYASYERPQQAQEQIDLWTDPIVKYCEQRKSLSTNGLRDIVDDMSRKHLASNEELVSLWRSYYEPYPSHIVKLNQQSTLEEKGQFITDFFEKGPFSSDVIKLVFQDSDNIPAEYKPVYARYQPLKSRFLGLQLESLEKQREVYEHATAGMQSAMDRQKANQRALPRTYGSPSADLSYSLDTLSNTIETSNRIEQISDASKSAVQDIRASECIEAAKFFPAVSLIFAASEA